MKQELSLFKALSDGTRLRIMVLLSEKELCVCQIMWALDLDQAKISRHLTVLRNAGLVKDRRDGLWIYYSLRRPRNELESCIFAAFKNYFKKTEFFKKDIRNMKKCIQLPLRELSSAKK
jgi:ArsR family transcriptional regulator